jgi:membrane-bound serine protease (ClpP class)
MAPGKASLTLTAMAAARALFVLGLLFESARALAAPAPVVGLSVTGVIGPATAEYVQRGLSHALREHAQLVVLRLDTPGGLDTSMRRIVQDILASTVPVVAYVAPSGARAASAGTFILYASHVAAMAPGTNLGAASPVSIGFTPAAPLPTGEDGKKPPPADVHERKAMQDAAAYIRSLAQLRGRNAEWGEKAVTEAASLSATEAVSQKVVELIAPDEKDLLRQLDGRKLPVAGGERVLQLAGAAMVPFEPDWHFRALALITDPSVAMILMLIGIYGLIFEFGHPGYVFPGVAGAVSLLLGLYALHLLPVNYAGLALIGIGVAFMVAEVFVPSYGSLGIGGVVAFVVGATMLIDTDVPGFGIPRTLIVLLALVTAAFVIVVVRMAVRARRAPIVSGLVSLIGADGEMLDDAGETGWANIRGETWQVKTAARLSRGQRVRVVGVDGMVPRVAPAGDL